MRIDVISIFPEYLRALDLSLLGKAQKSGLLEIYVHDLRDHTFDRHKTVDDTPYGGGAGMVMKPEPWALALEKVWEGSPIEKPTLVVPTPSGEVFSQPAAHQLADVEQRNHQLRKVILQVRDSYDIIIIDCLPSLGVLAINALVAADRVIVPMVCEPFALEGLAQLPDSCAASADCLEKQRAIFESRGVFSPAMIDGVIKMLRSYDDRTLRADIGDDQEKMLELVHKYFHCG